MDPDQIQEQSDLGPQCFVFEASHILVDDKNIHLYIL